MRGSSIVNVTRNGASWTGLYYEVMGEGPRQIRISSSFGCCDAPVPYGVDAGQTAVENLNRLVDAWLATRPAEQADPLTV